MKLGSWDYRVLAYAILYFPFSLLEFKNVRPSVGLDGKGLRCAAIPPVLEPQVQHAGAHGVKKKRPLAVLFKQEICGSLTVAA